MLHKMPSSLLTAKALLKRMNRHSIIIYLFLMGFIFFSCKEKEKESSSNVYYTCSMDPQVMESKPGNCPICKMPLTAVTKDSTMKEGELHLNDLQILLGNIQTDSSRPVDMAETIILSGVVIPNANLASAVSARAMGRIERLYVRAAGEYVTSGQPLYSLNSDELNLAIKEYLLSLESNRLLRDSDMVIIIESARRKLELLGLMPGQIAALRANGFSGNAIDLLSPASGVVVTVDAREGAYLMEGSPVLTLADYSKVWIEAQVYPQDLKKVMASTSAMASVPGRSASGFHGKLSFVNPEYNPATKINLARMEVDNKDNLLKPGMQANVGVITISETLPAVPTDAVILGLKGATVWLKTGHNKFQSVMVDIGVESNGFTEIISGLKKGDVVVVSGAYLLNSEYMFKQGANPMEGHDMSNM